MPFITLTSDLGERDHYVAAVKGALYSACADIRIVDISHQISHFDIAHAAFVLKNAYHHFPEGSIHLLSVESTDKPDARILLVKKKGHFFVGYDNGIFSLLFDDGPDEIFHIPGKEGRASTFPFREIMVDVACKLVNGTKAEALGVAVSEYVERQKLQPVLNGNSLRGAILYFDHYGNAMTNISRTLFEEIIGEKRFSIAFKNNETVRSISLSYNEVPEGEKLCIFNSEGYLEIAINKGQAKQLFGLKIGDLIQIEF